MRVKKGSHKKGESKMGKTLLTLFVFGMAFGMAQSVLAEDLDAGTHSPQAHDCSDYGEEIDRHACLNYNLGLKYGPRDFTRKAASLCPLFAFWYARNVDKGPHDITRNGASTWSRSIPSYYTPGRTALWYAEDIDKKFHQATFMSACKIQYHEICSEYKIHFNIK